MKYYSTNHNSPSVSLAEAISIITAPDGGIYMPEDLPFLPSAFFRNIGEMSLKDIAYVVTDMLIGDELDQESVRHLINETLTFDLPFIPTNDSRIAALELFHGPTLTSKDIGARFMAHLFSILGVYGGDNRTKIIIAGSGNSGSAVADAFSEISNTKITVLYPKANVSKLQLAKIHSKPDKVLALEVRGSYDDCIAIQRTAIFDKVLGYDTKIASANSVNIARIIPMISVFFYVYARMIAHGAPHGSVVISIPTGNLTALVAGLMAKRMGLPIKRFIAATNSNNAIGNILNHQNTNRIKSTKTIANEIDIISPSNLPRLLELYSKNTDKLHEDIEICSVDDEGIRMGITEAYLVDKYIAEPHTAVAYTALKKCLKTGENGVFFSTVHPALYGELIQNTIGVVPKAPQHLPDINTIPRRPISIPPIYQAAKRIIQQFNS